MIVITMSNCPPRLRGDLSKWLIEIDTCVFVGNLSARVRDAVWDRICENINSGRATMAFSSNGEQKLDFRIHNTDWEPIDFDGIKLVRRKLKTEDDKTYKKRSRIAVNHMRSMSQANRKSVGYMENYTSIAIKTTGIKLDDEIIELAAVRIKNGEICEKYSTLVKSVKQIPHEIVNRTGITNEMIDKNGKPIENAVVSFLEFCGNESLLGYDMSLIMRYLQTALVSANRTFIKSKLIDAMRLSQKKLDDVHGYGLYTVADYLEMEYNKTHRALDECILVYRIYEKLKFF